jgi:mercuric ion transport protein
MDDRTIFRSGAIGAIAAAACCATPLLTLLLPAVGLGAWLAAADFIVIALLFACLGLVALGLYRRRVTASAHCDTKHRKQGAKS